PGDGVHQPLAEAPAVGNAPAEDHAAAAGYLHRPRRLDHQHIDRRLLEGGGEVIALRVQPPVRLDEPAPVAQRRLQAAVRELEMVSVFRPGGPGEKWSRKGVTGGITAARRLFDRGPARIWEAQQLRRLVEGLAGSVVPRLAQEVVLSPRGNPEQQRVST